MIILALILAAADVVADPVIPVILQPVLWTVVGLVLAFGITSAITWLNNDRATQKNPAIAAAEGQVVDLLQKARDAVGNGPGAAQLGAALEAAFHSHTVAVGAPHADDPRAP